MYAIVERRFAPTATSRYLTEALPFRTTGDEDPRDLVARLLGFGARIGGRPLAIATDDEAAVLLAENAAALGERFLLPRVPRDLPRRLASKFDLAAVCEQVGIPAPRSRRPHTHDAALAEAAQLGFPVVVKNDRVWSRLVRPGVSGTTVVHDESEMQALVDSWSTMPSVVIQEYLPREHAVDWIAHAYSGDAQLVFTGRKLRSWPPHAGVTTRAYSASNPELKDLTLELCAKTGFRGICDLDWRLDTRDGRYRLLDFNPRMGAQFRLFERADGIDVVRAMYLDLTGQPLAPAPQVDGREYVVENMDVPAALAYRRSASVASNGARPGGWRLGAPRGRYRERELAWWARDDPAPALVAAIYSAGVLGQRLTKRLRQPRRSAPR